MALRMVSSLSAAVVVLWALWAVPLGAAENLVRNPGFEVDADGDGLPDGWQCRNRATGSWVEAPAADGGRQVVLSKDQAEAASLWLQSDLPMDGGKTYVVQYRVRAAAGSQYRAYLEWAKADGSYGSSTTAVANWQDGTGDWQRPMFVVTLPTGIRRPYLVLQLKDVGQVAFDDVSIREPVREPVRPGSLFSSSFEGGTTAWILTDGAEIVEGDAADGKAALRLRSPSAEAAVRATQAGIPSEPGRRYRLSYAVKAAGGSAESTGFQFFRVHVSWQRLQRDGIDYGGIQQVEGEDWQDCFAHWQRRTLEFTAPAKPTAGMAIACEVRGPGAVLLDDLVLVEVPAEAVLAPPLSLRLDEPVYRDTIYASRPIEAVRATLTVAAPNADRARVWLEDAAGKALQSAEVAVVGGRAAVSLPAAGLSAGRYRLRARSSAGEAALPGEAAVDVEVLPPAAVEVVLREDHVCLVNGRPFFPIGLWHAPDSDRALSELGRAGINLVYRTTVTPELLDRMARFNIKAVAGIRHALPADPAGRLAWEAAARQRTEATRNHPGLLGYFLIDEPLWCGTPLGPLLEVYRFHRQLDPYRPIWSNEAPRGTVADCARYAAACDITGVDIYPVPEGGSHSDLEDKGLTSVGRYVDKMRESVEDRKPVWMALQGFAWKHLSDRHAAGAIYPTWEQSRFMVYNAILHGAAGITWWGTHYIYEPEFWPVLLRVASELRDLSAVLVEPAVAPPVVRSDAPGLKILHKVHGGESYLLAANESPEALDAEVAVPFHGVLHVLFEDRTVAVRDGRFSDRFAPHGVHVYATTAALPAPLVPVPAAAEELSGESLRQDVEDRRDLTLYEGRATWIWYPGHSGQADSSCCLRRVFTVPADLTEAVLTVAGDDEFALSINGEALPLPSGGWSRAARVDIASRLRPGRAVLAVSAKDGGAAPCGFLLEMVMAQADGTTTTLTSDASWRAALAPVPGWDGPDFDDGEWPAAEVVAPYGGGAWGRRVMVRPSRLE
ncbi:MAG: hypothetical protein GX595_02250 [Lentisphaerae bacterium]|nr:hypothetical protein [Lentisphaerota bacterium]